MNFHVRLKRPVLKTSRLLEFCSQKELVLQTGHPIEQWPFVLVKELFDNALDAAEEAGTAPIIKVDVRSAPSPSITITDNGPGLAARTVEAMLDFNVRASSRQAHAIPTRGAQGNALKTLVAMAFALDGSEGETIIEACGVRHSIRFCVDHIRQVPKIEHTHEGSDVKIGTSVTIRWPQSARSILESAKERFLQIAQDYAWLNPHLCVAVCWDGEQLETKATDPAWRKWSPADPTPAHWYDPERFERLIAAYVADDQDHYRERTVRDRGHLREPHTGNGIGLGTLSVRTLFHLCERSHPGTERLFWCSAVHREGRLHAALRGGQSRRAV